MGSLQIAAVISGTPYRVTHPDGHPVGGVADFVGETSFLITDGHGQATVYGIGALDRTGTGIRFYQKDPLHEGRDIRIWQMRAVSETEVIAEHQAAI